MFKPTENADGQLEFVFTDPYDDSIDVTVEYDENGTFVLLETLADDGLIEFTVDELRVFAHRLLDITDPIVFDD